MRDKIAMESGRCQETGSTVGDTRRETDEMIETGDANVPILNSRPDLQKNNRKLRPRFSPVKYRDKQPYTRKRKTPHTFNQKATDYTRRPTSPTMMQTETNTLIDDSKADSIRSSKKMRLESPLQRVYSDRRRSYPPKQNVSDLSNEITKCLHIHEIGDASFQCANSRSQNTEIDRCLRSRKSQEVIPTEAAESDSTESQAGGTFKAYRIRHALDNRIWTKKGRTVALQVAIFQELFACQLTHTTEPSPFVFAYHIEGSWFYVHADSRKKIVVRKSDIDISALQATDPRAFFMEYNATSSSGGVILKSGAHEGYGITVNRRHRLVLSNDPTDWYTWYIAKREV